MNPRIKQFLWRNLLKTIVTIFICNFYSLTLTAQYRKIMSGESFYKSYYQPTIEPKTKPSAKFSIGLIMGLPTGIGVDAAYGITAHLSARMGYNYAAYAVNGYDYSFSSTNSAGQKENQSFLIDGRLDFSHIQATIDYSPKPYGKFRFIGGLNMYPINEISVGGTLKGELKFNKVAITSEDLGSGVLSVGFYHRISPFVGIGFGRTLPRKKMSASLDIAATYKGDYSVDLNIKEGIIRKTNEENAVVLEHNLNSLWYQKVWPLINLRIAYRLQ
jgi:hypothetical protein